MHVPKPRTRCGRGTGQATARAVAASSPHWSGSQRTTDVSESAAQWPSASSKPQQRWQPWANGRQMASEAAVRSPGGPRAIGMVIGVLERCSNGSEGLAPTPRVLRCALFGACEHAGGWKGARVLGVWPAGFS
mmetsp:Transcript_31330/g.86241  ORF Transcript_31330/g.86241 Transcript_31330/m.86241 type:complete len:133 (+) Transcript_31330:949-1347(+)